MLHRTSIKAVPGTYNGDRLYFAKCWCGWKAMGRSTLYRAIEAAQAHKER